jgi:hypothetical protein
VPTRSASRNKAGGRCQSQYFRDGRNQSDRNALPRPKRCPA